MSNILSKTIKIGAYELRNRIVMSPLTRMRADNNLAPTELNAEYYQQRATAGLIITEGSQISQQGQGYPNTPGIYTKEQIAGWKKVTEAVHKEGGLIFLQLWHVGRVSHSAYQPKNTLPVAPSAIAQEGNALLPNWTRAANEVPHELTINEIKQITEDHRKAAINAKEAGFDGVEIHGANGYLTEQFLRLASNQRTDNYGGSIENRANFLFEILEAVLSVWTNDKVGIRLSPFNKMSSTETENPFPLYHYVIKKLEDYNLAYLHLVESREDKNAIVAGKNSLQEVAVFSIEELYAKQVKTFYKHPIISAGSFDKQRAETAIEKDYSDAVAFGRLFLSTPDLPFRLFNGIAHNEVDRTTFYGGGSKGYTDYETYKSNK